MFRELVWPFIFGLLASMVVSFTLTALLCANLLRHEEERAADRRHWLLSRLYILLDPVQRFLDRMERGYANIIRWMLKHRFTNFARIVATVLVGFTFYYFIGSEMMPLADVGQASGLLEMQPGSSYQATEEAVQRAGADHAPVPRTREGQSSRSAPNRCSKAGAPISRVTRCRK